MRRTAGFTLIEVLITVTVMAILLVLTVVKVSTTEVAARDEERKSDTGVIARQLESYYTAGVDSSMAIGEYPGTSNVSTESQVTTLLRGIDPAVLRTPGTPLTSPMTFTVATNNSTTAPTPTPTTSNYVYQPLKGDGSLCTDSTDPNQECRKFNLYYVLEGTAGTQVITSKYQ